MYYLTKKYKSFLKLCMPLILIHICIKKKETFLEALCIWLFKEILYIIELTQ